MNIIIEKFLDKKIIYLLILFIISRIFYYQFFGIKFDSWTVDVYWQFIPKELLRNDLINSLIFKTSSSDKSLTLFEDDMFNF